MRETVYWRVSRALSLFCVRSRGSQMGIGVRWVRTPKFGEQVGQYVLGIYAIDLSDNLGAARDSRQGESYHPVSDLWPPDRFRGEVSWIVPDGANCPNDPVYVRPDRLSLFQVEIRLNVCLEIAHHVGIGVRTDPTLTLQMFAQRNRPGDNIAGQTARAYPLKKLRRRPIWPPGK